MLMILLLFHHDIADTTHSPPLRLWYLSLRVVDVARHGGPHSCSDGLPNSQGRWWSSASLPSWAYMSPAPAMTGSPLSAPRSSSLPPPSTWWRWPRGHGSWTHRTCRWPAPPPPSSWHAGGRAGGPRRSRWMWSCPWQGGSFVTSTWEWASNTELASLPRWLWRLSYTNVQEWWLITVSVVVHLCKESCRLFVSVLGTSCLILVVWTMFKHEWCNDVLNATWMVGYVQVQLAISVNWI